MDLYSLCVMLNRLKMSPTFEINHYVLMSLNLKKDLLNTGELPVVSPSSSMSPSPFERRHPLASWLSTMMLAFSSVIFTCIVFGRPFALLFVNYEKIIFASLAWYVVNFIPGVFPMLSSRPFMTVIIAMKEIQRVYGIYTGVLDANKEFPSQILVLFVFGFLKGTGAEILMFFARFAAGVIKMNSNQFLAPNVFLYPTSVFKASAVISAIFVMELSGVFQVDHNVLFACIIVVLLYLRLSMVWGLLGDPFSPFENLFCSIFFGGMWEAYQRVRSKQQNNLSSNSLSSNGSSKVKRN